MKRRHLLLMALSLIISVCMCFCLAACDSCGGDPAALAVPVVTISDDGSAEWQAVENASGYAYKIGDGEEQRTDKLSVTLTDGQSIVVKAVGDGENYSDSGWSEAKTYSKPAPQPQKLGKPEVSLDGAVASWQAVANASGYKYSLDGGTTWLDATGTSVTLEDGQSVIVKAVGNGTTYTDSDPSTSVTYNAGSVDPQPSKLGTPAVTLDGAVASWAPVANASGYKYSLDGGTTWLDATGTSVTLEDGQSVIVKAIGNGTTYTDGDPSTSVTYNAGSVDPQPTKLGTPAVTLDGAVASWAPVANASGYKYSLDGGTTWLDATGTSVTLEDGQSVIVKAVGDGTTYTDGDPSTSVTYNAGSVDPQPTKLGTPVVVIDTNGIATWAAISNASGYKYSLDDGATWLDATNLSVALTDGQTVIVKAIGNGTTYTDSDPSTPKTYEQGTITPQPEKLMAPTVEVNDEGLASWKAIEHATKYVYKINDGAEQETTELSVQLSKGQKILVKAIGDGENYLDSNFSAARSYIVAKLAGSLSFANTTTRESLSTESQVWKQNGITFTNDKAASKTNIADYAPVRLYQDSSINVEYPDMVKIVFNCSEPKYATALNGSFTKTSITHTVEGKVVTVKFNVAVNSFEVEKLSGQVRLDSIDVYVEKIAVPLDKPVVTIDEDGNASWTAVANANGYKYVINDGEPVATQETRVPLLANNATIKVYAVGDGENYANSAYSDEKTYSWTTVQLAAPTLTINNAGKVTWNPVEHAVKYVYVIGDGEEQETTECELNLTDGQSVKVKTIGERRYLSSDFGETKTYTAPTESTQLRKDSIYVSIARNGTVTVTHPNASSFAYKINDGEEQTLALGATFTLTSGQAVTVKAVGDGTIYTDSDYTAALTYTAATPYGTPENLDVVVEGTEAGMAIVSWDYVDGASYAYKIGNGAETPVTDSSPENGKISITITLAENAEISVKALGDGNDEVASDGNYSSRHDASEFCTAVAFEIDHTKTYSVTEILPIINYYGNTKSAGTFIVSGVVSTNKAYASSYKNIDITLKEGNSTLTLFRATFATGVGSTETKADELVNWTVTITGKAQKHTDGTLEIVEGTISEISMTAQDRIDNAKKVFSVPEFIKDPLADPEQPENVTYTCSKAGEFTLPATAKYGVTVTWGVTWVDGSVADIDNTFCLIDDLVEVTRPTETAKQVKVTATLSYGDPAVTDTVTFIVNIPAEGSEPPTPTETKVLEILPTAFNSASYAANNNTKTIDGYSVTSNQVMLQSGVMQFQKNNGTITVTGTFTKIEIVSTAGTFTVKAGETTLSNNNGTYSVTTTGEQTITIKVGNATGKISSITFYANA